MIPYSRVPFAQLSAAQIVKKLPSSYGTRKVHCLVHKSLPLGPILCQMNPVHILTPNFLNVCAHVIEMVYSLKVS